MKRNTQKPKPTLVAFYDIRPGNGEGLFSREKISKGGDEKGKDEEKGVAKHKQTNNIHSAKIKNRFM